MSENSSYNRTIRKAQSTLLVSGRGVIYFSVWGIIRDIFSYLYGSEMEDIRAMVTRGDELERIVSIGILIFCILIDTGLHFYVGLSAMAEGRGKKKSRRYLFCAMVLILITAFSIAVRIYSWWTDKSKLTYLVHVVVDITFCIALLDLLNAAFTIRHRGTNEEEER